MPKLSEGDQESVARFKDITSYLEDALFRTFKAAAWSVAIGANQATNIYRDESKKAWFLLVDKVVEYALEED